MVLFDVNAFVALAWDEHVHHHAVLEWFDDNPDTEWATCPVTESGFVRISSNQRIFPAPLSVAAARGALAALRADDLHHFLVDDVSLADGDFPAVHGHRQVTDAHLLTLARRNGHRLLTFDRGLKALGGDDVILLSAL